VLKDVADQTPDSKTHNTHVELKFAMYQEIWVIFQPTLMPDATNEIGSEITTELQEISVDVHFDPRELPVGRFAKYCGSAYCVAFHTYRPVAVKSCATEATGTGPARALPLVETSSKSIV
jgi:hypothetical protein